MENLYEILKNAPKGLKLYSPIVGDVELTSVCERGNRRIIEVSRHDKQLTLVLDEFGRFLGAEAECILFPSEKYKNWNYWPREFATKLAEGVLLTNHMSNLMWICGDKATSVNTDTRSIVANVPLSCVNWEGLDFATPGDHMRFQHILDSKGYVCEHGEIKPIANARFEDGDILYDEAGDAILIFKKAAAEQIIDYACYFPKTGCLFHQGKDCGLYGSIESTRLRMATQDEANSLLRKLVENDIGWDRNNLQLVKLKDASFTTWLACQPSYGICPPPMTQDQFERFLNMYLFDTPHISTLSLNDSQYRTELLDAILTKHSKKYRKERK